MMFLHAGAGLHGHEYSNSPTKQRFQAHAATLPSSESSESGNDTQNATRPISQLVPGMSYVSSLLPSPRSLWDYSSPDYFVSNYLPTRFRDVKETQSVPSSVRTSEDGDALPVYLKEAFEPVPEDETEAKCDNNTCNSSQCSRVKRSKTRFHFARPAPGTHNRLKKSQPRLLLQLRREHAGKSLPSVEVVPATDIAGSKLGSDDIVVMRSDHDKSASWLGLEGNGSETSREEDILAVISPRGPAGDGSAEIAMEDGKVWLASRKPNGVYDFCHTTDHGSPDIVRWVKRQPSSPTATQQFSFCTMDPLVRKHPFLGSLKPNELDVFETFTPSYSRPRNSRPASYAADGSHPLSTVAKPIATVSGEHRRLMTVTSIWISFCEEAWPGTLPAPTSRPCRGKGSVRSKRLSDDHTSDQPQSNPPTSPTRKTTFSASLSDRRTPCGNRTRRTASTGAAYMERKRAAARAASPSVSTEEAEEKVQRAEPGSCRRKMRAWAHRIAHPRSAKETQKHAEVTQDVI